MGLWFVSNSFLPVLNIDEILVICDSSGNSPSLIEFLKTRFNGSLISTNTDFTTFTWTLSKSGILSLLRDLNGVSNSSSDVIFRVNLFSEKHVRTDMGLWFVSNSFLPVLNLDEVLTSCSFSRNTLFERVYRNMSSWFFNFIRYWFHNIYMYIAKTRYFIRFQVSYQSKLKMYFFQEFKAQIYCSHLKFSRKNLTLY